VKLTQSAPCRNLIPHRTIPIPKLGRNRQNPLIPNTHLQQPLVPPFNHLPLPDGETERLAAAVGAVELGAVRGQGAAVVDGDLVAALGFARALLGLGVLGRDLGGKEGRGEEGEEGEDGREAHFGGFFGKEGGMRGIEGAGVVVAKIPYPC